MLIYEVGWEFDRAVLREIKVTVVSENGSSEGRDWLSVQRLGEKTEKEVLGILLKGVYPPIYPDVVKGRGCSQGENYEIQFEKGKKGFVIFSFIQDPDNRRFKICYDPSEFQPFQFPIGWEGWEVKGGEK